MSRISEQEAHDAISRIKELKRMVDDGMPESDISRDELRQLETIIKNFKQQLEEAPEDLITIDKPLEKVTYLDLCQGIERQQRMKAIKGMSREQLNDLFPEEKGLFDILQGSIEGYFRIQRILPSPSVPREGWSYAFGEGLPLHLDTPEEWYSTSNIRTIDWKNLTFITLNSTYRFELINEYETT